MDTFKEQIVKMPRTRGTFLLSALVWFLAMALTAVLLMIIPTLAVLVAFLLFYGAINITQRFNIEYEYILTNGELDIDKITAQRSRTRLCTFKCADVEAVGAYNKGMPLGERSFICCNTNEEGAYFLRARDAKGKILTLVFAPNEKMQEAIKVFLPRIIQRDAF